MQTLNVLTKGIMLRFAWRVSKLGFNPVGAPPMMSRNLQRHCVVHKATGCGGFLCGHRKTHKLAIFMAVRYCKITTNCQSSEEHHRLMRGAISLA